MVEYSVERILSYLADDAWAVEDGKGNQIMRFAWDKRQEAESLAEALNTAWRDGHARGVGSVTSSRLAQEHVEALMRTQGKLYCNISTHLKDAIRAALAALGEDVDHE